MSNFEYQPESSPIPEFIRPLGGAQPASNPIEMAAVADKFEYFMDERMFADAEWVVSSAVRPTNGAESTARDELALSGSSEIDGTLYAWSAQLVNSYVSEKMSASVRRLKTIELTFMDSEGNPREHFGYNLTDYGWVKRTDFGDELVDEYVDDYLEALGEELLLEPEMQDAKHLFDEEVNAQLIRNGNNPQGLVELGNVENGQHIGYLELTGLLSLLTSSDTTAETAISPDLY